MNAPVWLEVALNGPWARPRQPRIPITRAEIVEAAIACAGEGAAILHFHAYDETSGRQRDDYEIYAPIIERIRSRTDTICYATLPFAGSADAARPMSAEQRFEAVAQLARAGLIEWSVVDPGSTHIVHRDELAQGRHGFVYANPESHIRHGLELCRHYKLVPSYAIYEPGFMRVGAALWRQYAGTPAPVYRLMFSDDFAFGFPPQPWALEPYLKLLGQLHAGAPWMVSGLAVQIDPMVEPALERGGHVRVGLEDAPFGCKLDNLALTQQARARIEHAGGRLATPAEVRAATRLAAGSA